MTSDVDFDRSLASWFAAETTAVPDESLGRAMSRIARTRQRPRWLVAEGISLPTAQATIAIPAWVLVVLALLVAAGMTIAGARLLTSDVAPVVRPSPSSLSVAPNLQPTAKPSPQALSSPTLLARSGAWSGVTSMGHVRGDHTATLLRDGRVLVVGGGVGVSNGSAEIYDPRTGQWTMAGKMFTPRVGADHTATLLEDGTVLVAGGASAGSARLAELYDPERGRWTATGSMTVARAGHTATLLPDGRVLVAGGSVNRGSSASAELYDSHTGRWTATGEMAVGRWGHTATLLSNGTVLVAGGFSLLSNDGSGPALASAELYDPRTGRWTTTGAMAEARAGHTATLLNDGDVLVVAGRDDAAGGLLDTAERYDPATGRWIGTGSVTVVRDGHAATLLLDGGVLVTGGASSWSSKDALATVELYDPKTGIWTAAAAMPEARFRHTATLLGDGTVLVVGGIGVADQGYANPLQSAELYLPR